jgi:hypothetical protein
MDALRDISNMVSNGCDASKVHWFGGRSGKCTIELCQNVCSTSD